MPINPCDVNDGKRQVSSDPRDAIEIIGGNSIEVVESKTPDKTTYTIHYREYTPPTITVNTVIEKVGVTIPEVIFNATFNKGSTDFISRTMTPTKGLDLTLPFTWKEENVRGTEASLWPKFDGNPTLLSCTDEKGNTVTKQVGVDYRFLHYCGYSKAETITEAEIKALQYNTDLLTNIKSKYGSFTYNSSAVPTFVYWAFPLDSTTVTEASEGPLPVPLKLDHPPVSITDSGVTKMYRVIRTAVKTKFINATIVLK